MWIWAGSDIDAIQFQTTRGRLSPKYGGDSGSMYLVRGHNGERERALMAFKGRCSGILYNLEVSTEDSHSQVTTRLTTTPADVVRNAPT